jgi:two-component system nitrate/nitrite response regulator NarL
VTTVLIVDDHEDIRLLVRALIRTANQELRVSGEAATGEEALASLDDIDPSVVLLDHMMPGMTGLETAREILIRRPDQRIILFSAYMTEELCREARSLGVVGCLPKDDVGRVADAIRVAAA